MMYVIVAENNIYQKYLNFFFWVIIAAIQLWFWNYDQSIYFFVY